VKAELGTTSTSWSQHHFVAIGNPSGKGAKLHVVAASNNRDQCFAISRIACSRHAYILLFFAHIPSVVNHTINATPPERLQHYCGCGGLSPSKLRTKHYKLKYETLYISGVFIKFSISNPLAQTQRPPIEDFLATVLLYTKFFCNDGHFYCHLLLKQSSW